jgi:hypothetical protein
MHIVADARAPGTSPLEPPSRRMHAPDGGHKPRRRHVCLVWVIMLMIAVAIVGPVAIVTPGIVEPRVPGGSRVVTPVEADPSSALVLYRAPNCSGGGGPCP